MDQSFTIRTMLISGCYYFYFFFHTGALQDGVAPASFWLGAGIASLRMNQLQEAERALAVCYGCFINVYILLTRFSFCWFSSPLFQEANIQDSSNPVVWGYLALCCLLDERTSEAAQSLTQAIKLGLQNAQLFLYWNYYN